MQKKLINKEIRRISTFSSLPLLIFTLVFLATSILAGIIVDTLGDYSIAVKKEHLTLITYTVIYGLGLFCPTLLFYAIRRKKTGRRLGRAFRKPQMSWGWILKWFVIAESLTITMSFLTRLAAYIFETVTKKDLYEPDFNFGDSTLGIFAMFLALTIYAPFFEELFFRGTLYRHNEVLGQFFAIAICGVSFGLWHGNYEQLLYTMTMGCTMAFIFAKTRSIWPTILFHFLMNGYAALQLLALQQLNGLPDNAPQNIIYGSFVLLFTFILWQAGIVLMILEFAIKRNRDRNKLRPGVFRIGGFKKLLVYFSSPVTIITYLLLIAETVYTALKGQ